MITEDQLEQLCLSWFREEGYDYAFGPDIAHDGGIPERTDYRQVILNDRLLFFITQINSHIPQPAKENDNHPYCY